MSTEQDISIHLTPEEQRAVEALQKEMGLDHPDEVMHVLLRQAQQRIAVVCPNCGHSAQKTAEDEAKCVDCLSVMHLSEGIWEIISLK
ncbi:MAG: hypothetical protein U9R25_04890 [Chloroflexota bacterium]|nr:hypothetical protein [Chloroflexota bacterium]